MSRVRFETAAEVFETFPGIRQEIPLAPTEEQPLAFLRRLCVPESWSAALLFCACTLPRRESVWWAARSVRALLAPSAGDAGLDVAEAWVREPDDPTREAALAFGLEGERTMPGTWIALAAGWSGGGLTLGQHTANAPPDLTARTATAGLTLAACTIAPAQRFDRVKICLDAGLRVADGGALDL